MKKIKLVFVAAAALVGLGSAYAFKLPFKVRGTTYYLHYVGANREWTSTLPSGSCKPDMNSLACQITSTVDATQYANSFPPSGDYSVISGSGNIYK